MNELSRTTRTLAIALAALAVAGVIAATIVTFATSAAPVAYRFLAFAPGQMVGVTDCPQLDPGVDRDTLRGCDLRQWRHEMFPDAAHITVNDPTQYGFDDSDSGPVGAVLGSWHTLVEKDHTSGFVRKEWVYEDSSGVDAFVGALDDGGEFVLDEAIKTGDTFLGFDGSRPYSGVMRDFIASRNGVTEIRLQYTYGVDNAARHTVRWPIGDHVLVEPEVLSAGELTEVITPWSEWTERWAVTNDPVQERSLSLASIWGVTLGLLALVGAVGFLVAKPLMGVAQRAEDGRKKLERQAFGLAHDFRSPIRAIASALSRWDRDPEAMKAQAEEGVIEIRGFFDSYAEELGVETLED